MEKVAILVASHGDFAEYAMKSAEMIVGEQTNYGVLGVSLSMNLEEANREFNNVIETLDVSNGLVILVDLFGGTPSNIAGMYCMEHENVQVLSGLNIPMLIDLCLNRTETPEKLALRLEETYKEGFINVTKRLKESEVDLDGSSIL